MPDAIRRAVEETDREDFVPFRPYSDQPEPIGWYANIMSLKEQVAVLNTITPNLKPGAKVLDIGTGSGYSACLFAKIIGSGEVYSIDHIP